MNRPAETELARLLRADVPPLEDAQFVLTLAEVARSSAAVPIRRRVRTGVKVGAIAASVAVTMFGAAYASDLLPPGSPTHSNPSSPGTDEPTEGERESWRPRNPDGSIDVCPSPATETESSEPDGVPTEADTADATTPAGSEQEPSPESSALEEPPASDSGPGGGDDSGDDDTGPGDEDSEAESETESDPDDAPAPDDDAEDDQDGSETESGPDEDSGEPEPEDETESPDGD